MVCAVNCRVSRLDSRGDCVVSTALADTRRMEDNIAAFRLGQFSGLSLYQRRSLLEEYIEVEGLHARATPRYTVGRPIM